jgi:hypothetical protein
VLSIDLAILLRKAGLPWRPEPGDRFAIPDRDLDDEVFVLSDMTIRVYQLPEGSVIGFNGTTEWALDDVDQEEAIWLPREDQLRNLLAASFQRLEHADGRYRVIVREDGTAERIFLADRAEDAYAWAVLDHVSRTAGAGASGP